MRTIQQVEAHIERLNARAAAEMREPSSKFRANAIDLLQAQRAEAQRELDNLYRLAPECAGAGVECPCGRDHGDGHDRGEWQHDPASIEEDRACLAYRERFMCDD